VALLAKQRPRFTPKSDDDWLQQAVTHYAFRAVGGPIDAVPLDIYAEAVAGFHAQERRKLAVLKERLARAQVDVRLQKSVDLLEKRLGNAPADFRVGPFLSSLHSLEAYIRAHDTEEGRKELAFDLLAMIGDVAPTMRNFVGVYPEARKIETERLGVRLSQSPSGFSRAEADYEKIIAAASGSPLVTPRAVETLRELRESVRDARADQDKAAKAVYRAFSTANFSRIAAKLGEMVCGLASDGWRMIRKMAHSRSKQFESDEQELTDVELDLIKSAALRILSTKLLDAPEAHLGYINRVVAGALSNDVGARENRSGC